MLSAPVRLKDWRYSLKYLLIVTVKFNRLVYKLNWSVGVFILFFLCVLEVKEPLLILPFFPFCGRINMKYLQCTLRMQAAYSYAACLCMGTFVFISVRSCAKKGKQQERVFHVAWLWLLPRRLLMDAIKLSKEDARQRQFMYSEYLCVIHSHLHINQFPKAERQAWFFLYIYIFITQRQTWSTAN